MSAAAPAIAPNTVTASRLRENVYQILDQVLATGVPVEVVRKGRVLRIVPDQPVSKFSRLQQRAYIAGNPEELVHSDWSAEWKPLV